MAFFFQGIQQLISRSIHFLMLSSQCTPLWANHHTDIPVESNSKKICFICSGSDLSQQFFSSLPVPFQFDRVVYQK